MRSGQSHGTRHAQRGGQRPGTSRLSGAISLAFALLPFVALMWAVAQTGLLRR